MTGLTVHANPDPPRDSVAPLSLKMKYEKHGTQCLAKSSILEHHT